MYKADDDYGTGFYNYPEWIEAYNKLREITENA